MSDNLIDPRTRVSKTVYNKSLKLVNKLLVKNGKKPLENLPKGVPEDICKCPIAKALKPIGVTEVDGDAIRGFGMFEHEEYSSDMPDILKDFVYEFDHGVE